MGVRPNGARRVAASETMHLWEIEGEIFSAFASAATDTFGCPVGRRHVCAASDLKDYLASPAGAEFARAEVAP